MTDQAIRGFVMGLRRVAGPDEEQKAINSWRATMFLRFLDYDVEGVTQQLIGTPPDVVGHVWSAKLRHLYTYDQVRRVLQSTEEADVRELMFADIDHVHAAANVILTQVP